MFARSPPVLTTAQEGESSGETTVESTPLQNARPRQIGGRGISYGSIVQATPPDREQQAGGMPALALPDPAMTPVKNRLTGHPPLGPNFSSSTQGPTDSPDAYHVGRPHTPARADSSLPRRLFGQNRTTSSPALNRNNSNSFPRSKLRRMFTGKGMESPAAPDVHLEAYRELDQRQDEFFGFLDKELDKIEDFYKAKEHEATKRLTMLRDQLHEMRDQRLQDIEAAKHGKTIDGGLLDGILPVTALPDMPIKENRHPNGNGANFLQPVENIIHRKPNIGKTSKAMKELSSPAGPTPRWNRHDEHNQDYVRKNRGNEKVPYRFAKRRLKLALQEFYRGLELLKSYALLNRTGFRKINKKYDKAVNARPTARYMAQKVNNAYFVQSSVVEGHIVAVEDLYARYFERGNHKIAVNKLRSKARTGDMSDVSFRNGLYLATGFVLAVAGAVLGTQQLLGANSTISQQTSYLMQLYAGYFLGLLLFLSFVLACRVWTSARINYTFIFEYDTRHVLDWRQLAELPCFFFFLFGLFFYVNFQIGPQNPMFLYWPVILIGITLLIMALPMPILYHHARGWWGVSNWRLLLAGLYPVEFRDFFFGDMYCSETYTMSQVGLFFCLYAHDWRDPPQCNSNHSRLLGFLTALPAVWRALQCLRRYYDTRNWFPHLANCAKYGCNILYYMTLSLYRMHINDNHKIVFIVFAAINAIYCSFWDVFMDFSLGNPYASRPFLRDRLAFRKTWLYYAAMVSDVILRQQWIFYAIFTEDLQHSSIVSFLVGLAEVFRRGIWSVFRVENEHCNNVGKFRASRDIPLPYTIMESPEAERLEQEHPERATEYDPTATGVDLERNTTTDSSVRQRRASGKTPGMRAMQRVGTIIAMAHTQDFTKKKRPEVEGTSPEVSALRAGGDSTDEEEDAEDDDDDENDEADLARATDDDVTQARDLVGNNG